MKKCKKKIGLNEIQLQRKKCKNKKKRAEEMQMQFKMKELEPKQYWLSKGKEETVPLVLPLAVFSLRTGCRPN